MSLKKKLLIVGAIMAYWLITGLLINGNPPEPATTQVYDACISAHYETNGASEKRCGDLQDKYNIEFLCDQTGTDCWVEQK